MLLRALSLITIVLTVCGLMSLPVLAQERPEDAAHIWEGPARTGPTLQGDDPPTVILSDNGLPHVMITGYWPPTNEMLRQFSQDLEQNPDGWVGEDWEGRGYNIYSFFPEFPGGTGQNPKGNGDFEVDYQDTSNDWWLLVDQIHPIAIVTFSRANTAIGWELEGGNRTYSSEIPPTWTNDYLVPLKPTPELPSYQEPPGTERFSTLPIDAIIQAVEESDANVDPFSTVIDNGRFLSNYVGYHGNWYHDLHADRADEFWSIAGGHIHVGGSTALPDGVLATEVTLRVLTEHLDARRALIEDQDGDGDVDVFDFERMVDCTGGPGVTTPPPGCGEISFSLADLDEDEDVDFHDLRIFQVAGGT